MGGGETPKVAGCNLTPGLGEGVDGCNFTADCNEAPIGTHICASTEPLPLTECFSSVKSKDAAKCVAKAAEKFGNSDEMLELLKCKGGETFEACFDRQHHKRHRSANRRD